MPDRAGLTFWRCRQLGNCSPPAQPKRRESFGRRFRCGSKTDLERYGPVDATLRPAHQRQEPADSGLRFVGLVKASPTVVSTLARRQRQEEKRRPYWTLIQSRQISVEADPVALNTDVE